MIANRAGNLRQREVCFMDVLQVGATWLHLVATVALIGYYAILGVVVLPALRTIVAAPELAASVVTMERRATPLIVGSLAIFLATGVYLMGNDPQSGGIGNVTDSSWATLVLAKHGLVAVMVGIGFYVDALIVRRFGAPEIENLPAAIRRLVMSTGAITILGALVLLLTAAAQAA